VHLNYGHWPPIGRMDGQFNRHGISATTSSRLLATRRTYFDTGVLVPESPSSRGRSILRGTDHGDIQHPGLEAAKRATMSSPVAHRSQDLLGVGEHVFARPS